MPISVTWVNPSAAGALDLATGAVLTETYTDGVASDLLRLGGTTGFVCQTVAAIMQTNFSTSSVAYTDITGASVTLTTSGRGDVIVAYSGPAHATVADGFIAFNQDGVDSAAFAALTLGGQVNLPVAIVGRYAAPAAGSHTYKMRCHSNTGSGTLVLNYATANGIILAMEIR